MDRVPELLFIDKPSGAVTHATESGTQAPEGCVEHFARLSGQSLYVCHRLDKGTTGALVFAKTADAAARLAALFAGRDVQKTYLFLTDRPSRHGTSFEVESFIEKRGGSFISEAGEPNSHTAFRWIASEGRFSLWEARPTTGKPHQIRLHAADRDLAILGDEEHGGSRFPALALHSQKAAFEWAGEQLEHRSPPPAYFEALSLLANPRLCSWLAAVDRRRRWMRSREAALRASSREIPANETWRWIHTEGGPLRAEQLGSAVTFQWFSDRPPADADWADIRELARLCGWSDWRLHLRLDRGKNPNSETVWQSRDDLPTRWTAKENGLAFSFRADSGLSAGLFLDQRANRLWLRDRSLGKRVLNLFCYTGGFSVAAAVGGADAVVSVDLSKNFLEWARENMTGNGLDPAAHEFRAMDARDYLKYASRKELKFDLIVCDPPSFGRSDKGVFRLENEIAGLIESAARVLAPDGTILFACNLEAWSEERFKKEIAIIARNVGLSAFPPPAPDWDFEMPREPRVMKATLLSKFRPA